MALRYIGWLRQAQKRSWGSLTTFHVRPEQSLFTSTAFKWVFWDGNNVGLVPSPWSRTQSDHCSCLFTTALGSAVPQQPVFGNPLIFHRLFSRRGNKRFAIALKTAIKKKSGWGKAPYTYNRQCNLFLVPSVQTKVLLPLSGWISL